jgi:hypothetical protein
MNNIKTIYVIPICGFGNRLKFLSTTYSICLEYNINMKILWRKTEECNISYKDIFKEIQKDNVEFVDNPPKEDYVYFGHKHLNKVIGAVLQPDCKKYTNLIITGGHEYKLPVFSVNEFIDIKSDFYNSIIWNNDIQERVNDIKSKHNLDKYVGVHFRGLDLKYDAPDLKNSSNINFDLNSPLENFKSHIKNIKPGLKILLFTNKNISLENTIKISEKTCNRNQKDDMLSSIIEFILLTQSKLIIGSYYSSFSDEASFFNKIPKIIPYNLKEKLIVNRYHCYGLSLNKLLALNNNWTIINECLID